MVLAEFQRAEPALAKRLYELLRETGPEVLELTEEADALADRFRELGALPPTKIEDSQHAAVAVVEELDALVSWNYRHLVNIRRREAVRQISAMCGYYKPLQIATPAELDYERE